MRITDKTLDEFRLWLKKRGRVDGTADLYVTNVRTCAADPNGITNRLIAGVLAPNSMHTNIAALRAWARFTEDEALTKQLADLKLPPARRVHSRPPLSYEDWRRAVQHLQACDIGGRTHAEALRHVLLIIATRGLRSGDVLRLSRAAAMRALASGKLVYEGKGRKQLEVSAEPIREQLQALVDITNPPWTQVRDLISTSRSPKIASKTVWRASRRVSARIKIASMNPHRFRHTFATAFLHELRGDPNAIVKLQQYMGWESMATAARYVDSISQDELDTIGAGLMSGLRKGPGGEAAPLPDPPAVPIARGTPRRRRARSRARTPGRAGAVAG